jgi:outer membrane autotransporter protein
MLSIAIRFALFFSGINISVGAMAASSCDSSDKTITIKNNETEPCNLVDGKSLVIDKNASIKVPENPHLSGYGLSASAVSIGKEDNQIPPIISVKSIENHGILSGSSGVTVTYSGSVGKLSNYNTISGDSGAVWVSGYIKTLDNFGSIKFGSKLAIPSSIMINSAIDNNSNGKYGSIDTITNQKMGLIEGITINTILNILNNYGKLTLIESYVTSDNAAININYGNTETINNYGSVYSPYYGISISLGGKLENLNNYINDADSKGITAEQDAIQVIGKGYPYGDKNKIIRPSEITQITNNSIIYGKQNGIFTDKDGIIGIITNKVGGEIKGDKSAINNSGTINDGIYNSGTITGDINNSGTIKNGIYNSGTIAGDVELGSATLYLLGKKATLEGNATGTAVIIEKDSVVNYTHTMNVGKVSLLSGSKLHLADGNNTQGTISSDIDNGGDLYFNLSGNSTHNHIISGIGSVHQTGTGTTILTGENSYTGETSIESGTLQLGDNGATGSIDRTSKVTLGQKGILAFHRTIPTRFVPDIEGKGSIFQNGADLTLTGNVKTGKPISVTSGKLQFGDGANIGALSLTGIDNQGTVIVNGAENSVVSLDGVISGKGSLEIRGGEAVTTSDNTYSGQTSIAKHATLQLGNGSKGGTLTKSHILNNGTLALNLDEASFSGMISGNGYINKLGTGTTTLNSDTSTFTGSTSVEQGTLAIGGKLGTDASFFTVKKGATVTVDDTGTIGGTTTIKEGGYLAGLQGNTLTFGKDLILNSGANVDISLGAEETSSDPLFKVNGVLTLDGTLNVINLGSFSAGEYDIFHYGKKFIDNGITLVGGKSDSLSLNTHTPHIVYLVNTDGKTLNYWDGGDASKHNNGKVDGGDGIWQVGGNENWTSTLGTPNLSWSNADQFPIFSGVNAGTVTVNNNGGNVIVDGMQFRTSGYTITGSPLTLKKGDTGSAKIFVGTGNKSTEGTIATIESNLTGLAALETTGYGTLILAGENNYTGGSKVTRGTLQIGNGGTKGSIVGDVVTGSQGTLAFDRSNNVTFDGNITGKGRLVKNGENTTILSGQNTYTGPTQINAGTLQFDNWNSGGSHTVDIKSGGMLALNLKGTNSLDGEISGGGHLTIMGTGIVTLNSNSSAFTGQTRVKNGTFVVDGQLGTNSSPLNVEKDAIVDGTGTIGGTATIEKGGYLAGKQGDTLTFGKDLILSNDANINISLGAAETSAPELFNVDGNLTLAGTLKVNNLGGFSAGEYDIFHYGGALTDNKMILIGGKSDSLSLDTHNPHKVYLVNTDGMILHYWDGGDTSKHNNGTVDGGNGVWRVQGNHNWTTKTGHPNSGWINADQFAVFSGNAGTVQIDNNGGDVTVNGMQFSTSGYTLTGDPLTLKNDDTGSAKIRVGTGNKSTANMIATIASTLTGSATLETTDYGTLVLTGENKYTGGTKVTRGVLQIGDGSARGSISGDVATGRNASLTFNRSDNITFSDNITGQGKLVKHGAGILTLTGANSYSDMTEIRQGTLRQGKENAFSTVSPYTIGKEGIFDMGGFNTTLPTLNNSGKVLFGGDDKTVGRILTIAGNYIASNNTPGNPDGNNGTVSLSAVLAGDNSATDKFVVKGNTSGTTQLAIKNIGGKGALTTGDGIKVVDVQGASDGIFNLMGDYNYKGAPAVVGGAYAYRLYKNGTGNSDGGWYLRSSLKHPKPPTGQNPPPLYQAGVSIYEAYGWIMQAMNAPASLRDRTSEHKDTLSEINGSGIAVEKDSVTEHTSLSGNGAWGRITGSYGRLSPRFTTSEVDNISYKMIRAQTGVNKRLYENNHGAMVGGVFLQYSNIDADISSEHGKGSIRGNGYTTGVTGTWYGNNGVYWDGLAQLTYFDNKLDSKTANRNLGENKSALGYALSLETGKQIDLTPTWSITPQAQLAYSSINIKDFNDTFGARIHFAQSQSMKLRVGTTIDYRQKWRNDQSKDEKAANLYGLFNIRQELLGNSDSVDVSGVPFKSKNDRTWGETGVGGSYSWGSGRYLVYGQTSVNTSLSNSASNYELGGKIGFKVVW